MSSIQEMECDCFDNPWTVQNNLSLRELADNLKTGLLYSKSLM